MQYFKLFEDFSAEEHEDGSMVSDLRAVQAGEETKYKDLNPEEEAFCDFIIDAMDWNGGDCIKYCGHNYFSYDCQEGSSVVNDLVEACEEYGVAVKVEQIDSENYTIEVIGLASRVGSDLASEKIVAEEDYSEAAFKVDKWLGEGDEEAFEEYYAAMEEGAASLAEFLEERADIDVLAKYCSVGQDIDWVALAKALGAK